MHAGVKLQACNYSYSGLQDVGKPGEPEKTMTQVKTKSWWQNQEHPPSIHKA